MAGAGRRLGEFYSWGRRARLLATERKMPQQDSRRLPGSRCIAQGNILRCSGAKDNRKIPLVRSPVWQGAEASLLGADASTVGSPMPMDGDRNYGPGKSRFRVRLLAAWTSTIFIQSADWPAECGLSLGSRCTIKPVSGDTSEIVGLIYLVRKAKTPNLCSIQSAARAGSLRKGLRNQLAGSPGS
jgi:hypothetical protein